MYNVSLYVCGFVPDSTKSWELPEFVPFCAPYILSLEYMYTSIQPYKLKGKRLQRGGERKDKKRDLERKKRRERKRYRKGKRVRKREREKERETHREKE